MGLNHKVENVQQLLDDSKMLLTKTTNGNVNSAYSIINDLETAYNTLVGCWKGMDAGVQINNIVQVHNAMVTFRAKMADMAVYAYSIGVDYRKIQNSNGAAVDVPSNLSDDATASVLPEYQDNSDTVDITPTANDAKLKVDNAKSSFEDLNNNFENLKNSILNNWVAGDRHEEFEGAFIDFKSSFAKYQELLENASQNITNALNNYGA